MSEHAGPLASVAGMRVLAIDDLRSNLDLIRSVLTRAGLHEVITVSDSTTVPDVLQALDPDLVLLDLRMPGMDGFEVLGHIRRYANGAFLPVVMVTSDDSPSTLEHALDMGAHDFITKPFNPVELVLRVRNQLQTRMTSVELGRSRAWMRSRLDLFDTDLAGVGEDPATVRELVTAVIADDDLRIALQPITDMRGEVVLGMEALSRFPPGPLPHPGAWFAAAHHAGVGVELEVHAIAKALDLLPALDPEVFLSLNVSPATLMADLPSLLPHDVPWGRIVLELTEHVPVQDYPPLNLSLAPMRRRRSRLAIDDTGAGFASLRHIANLAPDVIKLDIAIVSGVDTDPTRHALAEMLSRFGERMAIEVVAEGVETEAQRASLLALGVTRGQGFLLGRPEVWA